jgi:hypothetical protein
VQQESCENLLRQPIKLTPGDAWREEEEEEAELAAIDALCSALCANKQGLIRTAIVSTHHNQTAAATNSQKQKFAATTSRETFSCNKILLQTSTKFFNKS